MMEIRRWVMDYLQKELVKQKSFSYHDVSHVYEKLDRISTD